MSIQDKIIIDNRSLSVEQIEADLKAFVESLPDGEAWTNFFGGGAGSTLMTLMSGLGASLSFHSLTARRESSLETTRLRSTAIKIASLLGYPVNRPVSAKIEFESQLDVGIEDLSDFIGKRIGTIDEDYPISLAGVSRTSDNTFIIRAYLGDWRTGVLNANNIDPDDRS